MKNNIETIRHSLAHVLALSVKELYPKVKLGIGPNIENGFYYDFDNLKIEEKDLKQIEKKMKEIIKKDLPFKKENITKQKANRLFKDEKYKLELIKDLKDISIYTLGELVDLCKGPHVKSTKEINIKSFKLKNTAGAYWRGDEKNKMLTRIYGLAFTSPEELKDYTRMMIEAEKRDHRKIGQKLDLFSFHLEAPGIPFFHHKGTIIYNELLKFRKEAQEEFGYGDIIAPSMLDVSIWKKSGHWGHYKDDMFFIKSKDKEFALRPMGCPGCILIYNNTPKSYRDLPVRYAEPALISRSEKSGELGGLFRVQQFKQDDSHLFITEDQIEEEIKNVIKLVDKIYKPFGIEYKAFLSTRPDDYMGDIKIWNKAEKQLKKILKDEYGDNFGIKEKDGAFYGPKIDYHLKDAIGRTWQCATIQLDFQMPLKFGCKYTDQKGKEKTPVMIHRTIMGSIERFMGILIEHYAGKFPLWLSPIQSIVIPVGESHQKYAEKIKEELKEQGIRAEANLDSETVSKKIRLSEQQKIPYILVVGDKEIKNNTVSVRSHNDDLGVMKISKFIEKAQKEIEEKK